MAKRGLRKGSKCIRRHKRSGRCAEFAVPGGKSRKAAEKPAKRKPKAKKSPGVRRMPGASSLKAMSAQMYHTSPEAFVDRAQSEALRHNIESFSPVYGASLRRLHKLHKLRRRNAKHRR